MKNSKNVLRVSLFTIALFIVGCGEEKDPGKLLTGQDYVNGIFFGFGPVAEKIPEIGSNYDLSYFVEDSEMSEALNQVRQNIVQSIDKDSLRVFANDMESGDHLRIKASMSNMANLIWEASQIEQRDITSALSDEERKQIVVIGKEVRGRFISKEEMKVMLDDFLERTNETSSANGRSSSVSEANCVIGPAIAVWAVLESLAAVHIFVLEAVAFWIDVGVQVDDEVASSQYDTMFKSRGDTGGLFKEQLINSIAITFAR